MFDTTIIDLLKQDHRAVAALLEEAQDTTARASARRRALVAEITTALTAHMAFEERHLYPALAAGKDTQDQAHEAREEHEQVKRLLKDLARTPVAHLRWKAKLTVLAEDIRHHVKEEEGFGGLFAQVKQVLGHDRLVALAERYQQPVGK